MGHTILLPLLERAADPIEELPAFMSQCLLLRSHRLTTKMVLPMMLFGLIIVCLRALLITSAVTVSRRPTF